MSNISSFSVLFIALLFTLSKLPAQVAYIHEEKAGVVSLEAEHFYDNKGWGEKFYYTGEAVQPDEKYSGDQLQLRYRIRFTNPGTYRLFILGNLDRKAKMAPNAMNVQISQVGEELSGSLSTTFANIYAPRWQGVDQSKWLLQIDNAGEYELSLTCGSSTRVYIDKLLLHNDPEYLPSGIGPFETLLGGPTQEKVDIILPPAWTFGVLYGGYTDQQQTLEAIDQLIEGDFPIDAYWIDSFFWDFINKGKGPKGYVDFIGDTTAFPDMSYMWEYMEQKSIKAGIWVWNLMHQEGNEELFREFNRGGHFNSIYTNRNGWHNADNYTITGVIDFEREETTSLWKNKMKPFFNRGLDFLKLDNSADSYFSNAAFTAISEYGRESKGRALILAHVSATNDENSKLYPARWTGDAKITWTQPEYPNLDRYAMGGLKENVQMVADPFRSTYSIPFLTNDVGGYDYFGSEEQSDELYMRWVQFASFNTMMTLFSTAKNPTRNHPYSYSEVVRDNFRKYSHLRMRLFPYIYSGALKTRLTGMKMIQGDGKNTTQFMLGDFILVAPVVEKGATIKMVHFPEGKWYDFENGMQYEGGKTISVAAPMDKIPWFVREGSILPMRKYARSVELGSNDLLKIYLYPSFTKSSYTLLEDDGISNDYIEGKYTKTTFLLEKLDGSTMFNISATNGEFENMPAQRTYEVILQAEKTPSRVLLNEIPVQRYKNNQIIQKPYWQYDADKKLVRITFDALCREDQKINLIN